MNENIDRKQIKSSFSGEHNRFISCIQALFLHVTMWVENIVLSNTIPAVESHILQLKTPLMFWFLAVFYDAHCRKYFWGKQVINLSLDEFCLFKEPMTVLAAKAALSASQKMELQEEKLHSKYISVSTCIKYEFFTTVCNKYSIFLL